MFPKSGNIRWTACPVDAVKAARAVDGHPQHSHATRGTQLVASKRLRACVDVLVGDAGETTDDGSASPILCMRGRLAGERRGMADTAAAADANTSIASNASNTAANDANAADAGAVPHDVFDSQGRRFEGPALEGTNILRLLQQVSFPS